MRIYLTGFMGAGKTSVGKCLAATLGYRFVDLDALIEAEAGMTVREIFERHREGAFRELEHACLRRTARFDDAVIATGGGTIAFAGNRAVIRRLGVSVWLNPSFSTIVERIGAQGKEDRPLFRSPEQALALFNRRAAAYKLADLRVDVGRCETPEEVAARIAHLLREQRCVI
ncbi:MAG: shikimate kinase [Acidobacteria bacterium]|nr:MAG: shikimate kinase [Acidobacteriota bacterium]